MVVLHKQNKSILSKAVVLKNCMEGESRVSVAQHVLKGGALAGDEIPVKVVLDPAVFGDSLQAGRCELVLVASGEQVGPRVKLTMARGVLDYSTASAKLFDVTTRFAVLESGDPVLFSQPFQVRSKHKQSERKGRLTFSFFFFLFQKNKSSALLQHRTKWLSL